MDGGDEFHPCDGPHPTQSSPWEGPFLALYLIAVAAAAAFFYFFVFLYSEIGPAVSFDMSEQV